MKEILIAPSVLSCDFGRFAEEIVAVEAAGADLIHMDVMDGHFVPNITIGPMIVAAAKKVAQKPLDVHLMIENPQAYIADFAKAGADFITVHVEAENHLFRAIELIKSFGKKAGVSLNPATPLGVLEEILADVDMVLVMTVNPGFGGQSYIASMDAKISRVRTMIEESGKKIYLEVDGGIKANNVRGPVRAGADVIVMGTEVFHSQDYAKKIQEVRKEIATIR